MATVIHDHGAIDWERAGKHSYEVAFHQDGTWGNVLVPLTVEDAVLDEGLDAMEKAFESIVESR